MANPRRWIELVLSNQETEATRGIQMAARDECPSRACLESCGEEESPGSKSDHGQNPATKTNSETVTNNTKSWRVNMKWATCGGHGPPRDNRITCTSWRRCPTGAPRLASFQNPFTLPRHFNWPTYSPSGLQIFPVHTWYREFWTGSLPRELPRHRTLLTHLSVSDFPPTVAMLTVPTCTSTLVDICNCHEFALRRGKS